MIKAEVMKLKKIIYVSRITLPKRNAHTIQIVRNSVALANQNVAVDLFVRRNKFTDNNELSKFFGVKVPSNLKIKTLPPVVRQSSLFIAIFIAIKSFVEKSRTIFYIRDFKIAKELIKLKWLHRLPIFTECHAVVSYFHKESNTLEKKYEGSEIDWRRLREYVLGNSDGVILISKDTLEFVNNNYPKMPVIFAWHGTEPNGHSDYKFFERKGIYYVGNFTKGRYKIKILLDAMRHIKDETLILVGKSSNEDALNVTKYVESLGISKRVLLKEYIPPAELKNYLKSAKIAVLLLYGLKLSEYLSYGIPIVAPDIPHIREILRGEESCILFQPDDSKSLGDAINKILDNPALAESLARNAHKTAQEYSWQKRAEKILNFIENNIQ